MPGKPHNPRPWFLALTSAAALHAQNDSSYIMRSAPYPIYYQSQPRDYNLKWGPLSGRFHGSLQTEWNDNINLSDSHARGDLIFHPQFGIGFLWPLSEQNVLEFGLSLGYRAYLDHPELNSLQITPGSRLTYQVRLGKVQVTFHDRYSIQVDPLSRPEISGGSSLINFRRFNNQAGFKASWEIMKDLNLTGGYNYLLDRSLSSDFKELDRDEHVFSLGAYRLLGPRLTAGLNSSYTITEYVQSVQNDGETFSIGPHIIAQLTDFISLDAGLSYTASTYDQSGTIADRNDFSGLTWFAGARHRMNSRTSQNIRLGRNVAPGFGSNFTDLFFLQYGLSLEAGPSLTLNTSFVFEDLTASGGLGEDSNRYLWYFGGQLRVSRAWNLGAAYSFAWKDSQLPNRDYTQNRITLSLARDF